MQVFGAALIVIASSLLILQRDWRVASIAVGAQYAGLALVLTDGFTMQTALVELALCCTAAPLLWISMPSRPALPSSSSAPTASKETGLEQVRPEKTGSESLTTQTPSRMPTQLAMEIAIEIPRQAPMRMPRLRPISKLDGDGTEREGTFALPVEEEPLSVVFRALALLLGALVAFGLSGNYPVAAPGTAPALNFTFYWLVSASLLALGVTRNTFNLGFGLLFLLEAVQLMSLAKMGNLPPAAWLAMVAMQLLLILAVARSMTGRVLQSTLLVLPLLLVAVVLVGDVAFSSLMLSMMALIGAFYLQKTSDDASETANGMKFVALAVVAGACLQVTTILPGDYQVTRDPLLARVIVAFLAMGLAALVGAFPFHWWLLELPRRASPLAAAVLICSIGLGSLAFVLQMVSVFPWLLADSRSQVTLMALGVLGCSIAALVAVSRRDFTQLLMWTVAGNSGVILAGVADNSIQALIGAGILLLNQTVALLLLLLCSNAALSRKHKLAEIRPGQPNRWLDLEDFVPLTRQAPFLAIGIILGSLTLLGVPPFSGFLGRWMVYLEVSRHSTLLLVLIVGSSVLSLFSFAPVFRRLLSGLGRVADSMSSSAMDGAGIPWSEPAYFRAILLILALVPLITGIYPLPILDVIASALNGFRIEQ